jgi:hypothetical protein
MNNEYIIVNKTAIQQIDKLIKEANVGKTITSINSQMADSLIRFKKQILSQSTPLIPVVEDAFREGSDYGGMDKNYVAGDYSKNLKLDI